MAVAVLQPASDPTAWNTCFATLGPYATRELAEE
jgi:hypothetical protein